MAEVFRAAVLGPEGFRRELVVKRVLPALSARPRFTQMFVNEAKISALLAHPNIVQIFEFGESDGSYFIAMESIRGLTLREVLTKLRLKARVMPVVAAVEIARETLIALDYAHNLRSFEGKPLEIVHRDISPSNIMVADTGAVKVLDFGIARAADHMSEDEGKVVKGKIAYLAPEQITCGELDQRVDVFAMGCVLHELLTGRVMFRAQNDLQKKVALLAKPSTPPSAWNPDVPPAVDAIVLSAVERDPNDRYASAADMLVDIDNYLAAFRSSSRSVLRLVRSLADDAREDDTGTGGGHTQTPEPPGTTGTSRSAKLAANAVAPGITGARAGQTDRTATGHGAIEAAATSVQPARLGGAAFAERDRVASHVWRRRFVIAGIVLLGMGVVGGGIVGVRALVAWVSRPSLKVAAPKPPPADPFVLMTFQSTPQGASILAADGRVLGTTPATLPIPPAHVAATFRFQKDGFEPATSTAIPDRDRTIEIALHPIQPVAKPKKKASAKRASPSRYSGSRAPVQKTAQKVFPPCFFPRTPGGWGRMIGVLWMGAFHETRIETGDLAAGLADRVTGFGAVDAVFAQEVLGRAVRHGARVADVARRDGRSGLGQLRRRFGHGRRLRRSPEFRRGADRPIAGGAGLSRRDHRAAGLAESPSRSGPWAAKRHVRHHGRKHGFDGESLHRGSSLAFGRRVFAGWRWRAAPRSCGDRVRATLPGGVWRRARGDRRDRGQLAADRALRLLVRSRSPVDPAGRARRSAGVRKRRARHRRDCPPTGRGRSAGHDHRSARDRVRQAGPSRRMDGNRFAQRGYSRTG